jgi:hypothetical protein
MFAHAANGTSASGVMMGVLTALTGNTIPWGVSTNIIVIPRDGWYKISLDTSYVNAAGTNWYSRVFVNGNNWSTATGNQSVVASGPSSSISRNGWFKAGDRVNVGSAHNEASVPRDIIGQILIEELIS